MHQEWVLLASWVIGNSAEILEISIIGNKPFGSPFGATVGS